MDGPQETMKRPILRVRHDDGIGGDGREAESARRGEHGMALLAWDELGVEVSRPARSGDTLEEGNVAREKEETIPVG